MGRKRKFQLGDICLWNKPIDSEHLETMRSYAVIVDYKKDATGRGIYRVQRVLHPINGGAFGEAVWVLPQWLIPTPEYTPRMRNVWIYKANEKMPLRGCTCNCCAHESLPHGSIRKDGTFTWDDPDE